MKKKEVLEKIEKLAEKLGKTAEQLFGYYVKNAKMQKYFWPVYLVASITGIVIGVTLFSANFTHDPDYTGFAFALVVLGSMTSIISLACLIGVISEFSVFINSFVNPEYEAIEEIINKL